MRKLLNKPWFVGLLALAALAFAARSLLANRGYGKIRGDVSETSADSTASEGTVAQEGKPGSIRDALKDLSFSTPLRDPFAARLKATAQATEKVAESDITESVAVSAVWIQDGAAMALINNRICRAGDHIGRLTVETVNRDGIWVTHWKGRDFVAVGGAFTLTTPAREAVALATPSES